MSAQLPGVPIREVWLDLVPGSQTYGKLQRTIVHWLNSITSALNSAAQVYGKVQLTAQSAAITTTAVPTPTLGAGRYRLSYRVRVTTPASVTSSVTVTLGWTGGGVVQTQSFAALTGNAATSQQSGQVLAYLDANTTAKYATAYASNAAGMQYELDVYVEAMP